MKASDIKIGTIGYGPACNMGNLHFNHASKAGMVPTAVCDLDKARLEIAKKDFPGIKTFTSINDFLKDSGVDLVVVILPHHLHAKVVVQCLNAGKHVICEKPMATNTAECDAMIAASKKNKRMLAIYQSRHWDGCIMQAVKDLKSKPIGDIIRIEAQIGGYYHPGNTWRASKSRAGSILLDWGAHLLEYTFELLDSEILEVTGYIKSGYWAKKTVWKQDTIEDEGFLVVRYKNGAWSTMRVTSIDSNPRESVLEVTGTEGTYLFTHESWKMIKHKDGVSVTTKGRLPEGTWHKFYENIANHLTKGEELVMKPELSRRIIHVMDLAARSAKAGKALTPKYK
jgi:scyllo-inositol 2-dehydrogenase (NADP+)